MVGDTVTKTDTTRIAPEAVVTGQVTLGEETSVFYHCVLRGDMAPITVGSRTNIQENTVVHVDTGAPVQIGDGVTVGHGCIIHGCTIADHTLIGMGSIVMNHAKIGRNCLIGAGSLVTEHTQIPDGCLALGRPAKVIRPLTEEEIRSIYISRDEYIEMAKALF